MSAPQLVTVVIPAHNAAQTLDETLQSVRSQSHEALEIIVVDDGSTDDTATIAARHAEADARLLVLSQENAGVAAARNAGWKKARSELIAFVDADDLWAPTKIERQVQRLQAGGPSVGLVYCWSTRIDHSGAIISVPPVARCEGDVLAELLRGNFVGNGSSALVRREALIDVGGFDSRLRAANAEGCEDFLFYNRVAGLYEFALVPELLVGYRYLPDAMSRDRIRMLRSWMMVCDEMLERHPELSDAIEAGLGNYASWIGREALGSEPWQLPLLFATLLRHRPAVLARIIVPAVARVGRSLRQAAARPTRARPVDPPLPDEPCDSPPGPRRNHECQSRKTQQQCSRLTTGAR